MDKINKLPALLLQIMIDYIKIKPVGEYRMKEEWLKNGSVVIFKYIYDCFKQCVAEYRWNDPIYGEHLCMYIYAYL